MKKLKVVSAVVVCICLIASMFAGCQKISFEGKWKATIDVGKEFSEGCDMTDDPDIGKYYEKFNTPLSIDIIYTFDSDNSYTCAVDEEKFKADFEAAFEKGVDYAIEGMYKYAEDQGLTRDEFDAFYKEQEGVSLRESMIEGAKEEVTPLYNDMIEECAETEPQHLMIRGDRFYNTDDNGVKLGYQTFTLEGDTLTITGEFDMEDKPVDEEEYPLLLTKMN